MEKVLIFGRVSLDKYFRAGMLKYASRFELEISYIQCDGNHITVFSEENDFYGKIITFEELCLRYKNPDMVIFNFGLAGIIRTIRIKLLINPKIMLWDYIDDYYYGDFNIKNYCVHKVIESICDGVLVLNRLLSYRFKNPILFPNASSVGHSEKCIGKDGNAVVTLSSIDRRFDFDLYKGFVSKNINYRFDLYGWVKNSDQHITKKLAELEKYDNFKYMGSYLNSELDDILSGYNFGLIPYKVNHLTFYINPDKYYHYNNAGLKIISVPIPLLLDFENIEFVTKPIDLSLIINKSNKCISWGDNVDVIKRVLGKGAAL